MAYLLAGLGHIVEMSLLGEEIVPVVRTPQQVIDSLRPLDIGTHSDEIPAL